VGTGSPRRTAQLLAARPDLVVTDARGNVDTRIRRLDEGRWDAIVLARAGLARLGRLDEVCDVFSDSVLLPAIGQGALALVVRRDEQDSDVASAVAVLDHGASHREVLAERRLLRRLHAGCRAPLAARAVVSDADGRMTLEAGVFSLDGREALRERAEGSSQDPVALADRVASALIARGADRILQEARS
jgi:hydroxymethylbilane synthase